MADRPKTLVIVEGKRTEPVLFRRMAVAFGMDMDVYSVGGNIYAIYRSLERERFEANVKDVAAELSGSAEDRKVLSQDFADTFLVFDCDPHHTAFSVRLCGDRSPRFWRIFYHSVKEAVCYICATNSA